MHEELLHVATRAARTGGRILKDLFRSERLEVQTKAPNDLVSRADRESEAAILEEIRRAFPDHDVLAEESGHHSPGRSRFQWILDPLDGTGNFIAGLPIYSVSVACRYEEELVLGVIFDPEGDNEFVGVRGQGARWNGTPMAASSRPGLDGSFLSTGFPFRAHAALDLYLEVFREVFSRARGIRRCGSAALDLAYTAAGVYDGFFEFRLAPWDVAAGVVLIREAGGVVTDVDGTDRFLEGGNIVGGGPRVQEELRRVLATFTSEEQLARLTGAERGVAG